MASIGYSSEKRKQKQPQNVTLAIGLGGAGIKCVREIKRNVYENILPDEADTKKPSYSHIKFLAVDIFDDELRFDLECNSLDKSTEFFDLFDSQTIDMINSIERVSRQPEYQWLKTFDPKRGGGGIKVLSSYPISAVNNRQVVRMMMINKSLEFTERISKLLVDACQGLPGPVPVSIHVFAGLGGAVGSGVFLDVCYLIRKVLHDLGLQNAFIFGYFFLPDVMLSIPAVAAKSDVCSCIMSNSYAAMKELDYCMNFRTNGGMWQQQYNGFQCGPEKLKPVDICHLVSAKKIRDTKESISFDTVVNTVSEYVLQFICVNSKTRELIANYDTVIENVAKLHGAGHNYCLLGAAKAVYPRRRINTYLASKYFEVYSASKYKYPTEEDVERFLLENDLHLRSLQKQIMSGTSYTMPPIALSEALFRNMSEKDLQTDKLILPSQIIKPYRNMLTGMENLIKANSSIMTAEWNGDTDENTKRNSMVYRVYLALGRVVEDSNRGPFYAASLLYGSEGMNIVRKLADIRETVRRKRFAESNILIEKQQAVKEARNKYLNNGFRRSNRQSLFDDFIREVAKYYTSIGKIRSLEIMEEMIVALAERYEHLYNDHFKIYCEVMSELFDTFHMNYIKLCQDADSAVQERSFSLEFMEKNDRIREHLDIVVKKIDSSCDFGCFNKAFFNRCAEWREKDEEKITQFVSDYINNTFEYYLDKSSTEYLGFLFETDDEETIQNKVFNEILNPLCYMASPLFWLEPYSIPNERDIGFIFTPDKEKCVSGAVQKLVNQDFTFDYMGSGFGERFLVIRLICGVPMFSYAGIDQCIEAYENDRTVGRHIYEGTEKDPRDWRELPNLKPFSMISDPSEELLEYSRLYDRAVEEGIIRKVIDTVLDKYEVVEFASIDEIEEQYAWAVKDRDLHKAYKVRVEAEEYLANRQPVKRLELQNDGAEGYEELVRKDYVIGSAPIRRTIREQLRILDRAREIISEVQHMQDLKEAENEFLNALLTGVIKFEINKVTCVLKKGDESKEVIISDFNTKPYGHIVLYQGFITYAEMEDVTREAIRKEVEDKLNDISKYYAEIKAACDDFDGKLSDVYIGAMQHQAEKIPEKTAEIEEFFISMKGGIGNFRLIYGVDESLE